jgi:hypothetical protein
LLFRVETGRVSAGGANAERERLPPRLEGWMLDTDGQSARLDLAQTRCFEELAEVTLSRTREARLILDSGVEVARRLPEHAEWSPASGVIPHARRDDTVLARHASHLAKTCDGVCHEVNDQLGQGGVERSIFERQILGRGTLDADPRVTLSSCCDEGL